MVTWPDGRRRRLIVGGGVAAMALALTACASQSQGPILVAPAGSSSLLSTSRGIIWSFRPDGHGNGMLRSADKGQHWQVMLPGHSPGSGLVASYFLGAGTAWALQAPADGSGNAIMLGTVNGGTHWWHAVIPGSGHRAGFRPRYQIYFANAQYGWVLATGTSAGSRPGHSQATTARERLALWRTTDGGRQWTRVRGSLPLRGADLRGADLARSGHTRGCAIQPAIAFANPLTGWLAEGSCHSGPGRPAIWRTADGGRSWSRVALASPPGGFGRPDHQHGNHAHATGVVVGPPRVVQSGVHGIVLVPIALAHGRLAIEESRNGGRDWTIASVVHTGTLPAPRWWPCWFDPIASRQWIVSTPGKLFETHDAGKTWTVMSTGSGAGAAVSFTNLGHGYMQGSGAVIALKTEDGGQTWRVEYGESMSAAGPAAPA
jgi:photosystem II stability/assembly factor-like uncharacterized protein